MPTELSSNQKIKIAMKVSWISIMINVLLTLYKLAAGILGNSSAMVSDAIHTASDISTTFVVMVGVKLSGKEADMDHQYGHERFECVAAVILAVVLAATGLGVGYDGLMKVLDGITGEGEIAVPGLMALIAAVVSIAVKEWMYWYTRAAAKKIGSGALMADAWHHRSDGLSSIGSFLGILGARMGFPILDPIACLVICVFILKAAWDIFMDAMGKMTDKACDAETEARIRALVECQDDVLGVDTLRTRLFGDRIYVDVEIRANGSATLDETHQTAQRVHDAIEADFPKVKHCMVHVNPASQPKKTEPN
jgi:cation diffusion facilitator family transporter